MAPWLRISIAGSATLFVGMGIGRFSYTPLIPALIEGGALSDAEAGYVGAFNLTGYLVGAIAAPRLRRIRGEVWILNVCLAISLVCLIASIPPWGFAWLAFWRFLVGVTVAVMMIYSLAIVTRSAPRGRLGAATGVVFTGVGIAILSSGTLVPVLLDIGLEAAWAGLAALGAVGVGVGFWGWRAANDGSGNPSAGRFGRRPRITASVAGLILAQSMFTIGLIPHTIYWVDYLVRGLGGNIAFGGAHWVLFGIGAVSGTYLWGRLADGIGFRAGLALVLATLAVGVAVPVVQNAAWALVFSSMVVGAQPGFSAIISGRTHQVVGAEHMAQVWRWMALTGGIFQAIGGYALVTLFEITQSYTPVFLTGGAAMALGTVISLGIKASPQPVEARPSA